MVLASFAEKWAEPAEAFAAQKGCWLVLDRVRDPGNLGTILRTADAVAAEGVLLVGECCDAFSVEAVRASMGALFNIPMAQMTEAAFIDAARDYKGAILGTALPASVDYREADWQEPMMLMMDRDRDEIITLVGYEPSAGAEERAGVTGGQGEEGYDELDLAAMPEIPDTLAKPPPLWLSVLKRPKSVRPASVLAPAPLKPAINLASSVLLAATPSQLRPPSPMSRA